MFRNVVICIIAIMFSFAAGNAVTDFVEKPSVSITPEIPPTDLNLQYNIDWTITINNTITALGLTTVCIGTYPQGETLLWVSHSGPSSAVSTDNKINIYNLNTRTLVDSFNQPDNSAWGYRDMCFLDGYVYAGYEGYIDKYDPVTHAMVGHYAFSTTSPARALADNNVEDSLWTSNFTVPIYKLWNQGGAGRQVAPAVFALYGLAYDPHGYMWGYSQNPMSTLSKYTFPSFAAYDSCQVTEIINPLGDSAIAGGCEMWRDSFLLILGQAKPLDKVYCLRVYFPPASQRDVGVDAIISPGAVTIPNTPIVPIARVKNFGALVQTNIPVVCSIVGAGSALRHYATATIPTLAAGDTVRVPFAAWTPSIEEMCTVIMRTNLTNDSNPGNDRMTSTTNVTSSIEIIIGTGTTNTYLYPMYCGQAYSVAEDIYLQSEIGYYGQITTLAYSKASGATLTPVESVAIYMKHTSEDTLITGSWDTTGYTRVYSGSFPNNATTGWMQITLDSPFVYNNVDNLKILILKGPPSFTGYPYWHYTTTTPAYRNRYGSGATPPTSLTRTVVRPNIRFALTPTARPQRDVGVREILNIGNWQFPNTPMTPQATVVNYGSASQTFPVVCSIVNMSGATRHVNTQTISLASLAETTVTFSSFNPTVLETLNVIVRTNLTNDTNPSNNRMTKMTRITNIAEIIIGTGTSASGAYVLYRYYRYSVSEQLYLQSEIGYYGDITDLAYYKNAGTDVTPIESVAIFMKQTTATNLVTGAWDTTGYTLVWEGTFTNNAAPDWMNITLDTRFLFNNNDNLQVLVFKSGGPTFTTGYPTWRYTSTTPDYRLRYSNLATLPTSLTQNYNRPNIRFYLSPVPPPQKDVGVEQILAPLSVHMINTAMTPIARVKNYGAAAQTFPVVCSIVGSGGVVRYVNTQTVTNLAAGDTTHVTFTAWTPTIAEMDTVIMRTLLLNDSVPTNDRKSRTTTIGIVMLQTFEVNDGGYIADPASAAWEWGVPTIGPTSAHSGTKVWGTLLGANYTASANWKLTTDNFVAMADNPVLQFWHWYDTEVAYDGGNVKISTDHGANFTLLTPIGGYSGTANSSNVGIPLEPCFTGHVQGFWEEEMFVLPIDSGQNFMIRWHFGSDGSVFYPGWYVDDVAGINFVWTGITEEVSNDIINLTTLNTVKPNPIKGIAHISFNLALPTHTSLKIYDASGRIIRTLVNSNLERGEYNLIWNGTDDNNRAVAEGVYFYTLKTDNYTSTKKLVMTR